MALVSVPDPEDEAVIRRERFVWVTDRPKTPILSNDILPLALSAPTTLDYRAACDAMEAENRRYRVAFASDSLAGLIAITRAGHAVSVLTETAVPPDLHIISDGLPDLPRIGIALEFRRSTTNHCNSTVRAAHVEPDLRDQRGVTYR